MTPKPLADRLLEACEFDETLTKVAIRKELVDKYLASGFKISREELDALHALDSEVLGLDVVQMFLDYDARLRPLLEAAAEVVRAAEDYVGYADNERWDLLHPRELEKALAKLNRLLGEG